jgi:hypothetical protein
MRFGTTAESMATHSQRDEASACQGKRKLLFPQEGTALIYYYYIELKK